MLPEIFGIDHRMMGIIPRAVTECPCSRDAESSERSACGALRSEDSASRLHGRLRDSDRWHALRSEDSASRLHGHFG